VTDKCALVLLCLTSERHYHLVNERAHCESDTEEDSWCNNDVRTPLRRTPGRAEVPVAGVSCQPVFRLVHQEDRLSGLFAYYHCPNIQISPHFARSSNFQRGAMTRVEATWGL